MALLMTLHHKYVFAQNVVKWTDGQMDDCLINLHVHNTNETPLLQL